MHKPGQTASSTETTSSLRDTTDCACPAKGGVLRVRGSCSIVQRSYRCVDSLWQSDHWPVVSTFAVQACTVNAHRLWSAVNAVYDKVEAAQATGVFACGSHRQGHRLGVSCCWFASREPELSRRSMGG